MFGGLQSGNNVSDAYSGTRSATQDCHVPPQDCGQMTTTTRIIPHTVQRQNRPHVAEYNGTGSRLLLCRCANPEAHGDAFTRRNHVEVYEGRELLDISGRVVGWEDYAHRMLDAAGKDQIIAEEAEVLWPLILNSDAVNMKRRQLREARMNAASGVKLYVESNVIWHGRFNPKRHPILPVECIPTGVGAATEHDRYGTLPPAGEEGGRAEKPKNKPK